MIARLGLAIGHANLGGLIAQRTDEDGVCLLCRDFKRAVLIAEIPFTLRFIDDEEVKGRVLRVEDLSSDLDGLRAGEQRTEN